MMGGGTGGGVMGGGTGGGGASLPGETCLSPQTLQFVNNVATFTGTTANYRHDFTSSCANAGQPDRVFVFTQPTSGSITFSLMSSGFQPALSLHAFSSGMCGAELNCLAASSPGSTLTLTRVVPAGTYAVVIDSATTGGGVFSFTATRSATMVDAGSASVLQNGVPLDVSGASQSLQYFTITVPVGQTSLSINTVGGTGDVDVYAEFGMPANQSSVLKSDAVGNTENITIPSPQAGVWHITLSGYSAYSGASLTATY